MASVNVGKQWVPSRYSNWKGTPCKVSLCSWYS